MAGENFMDTVPEDPRANVSDVYPSAIGAIGGKLLQEAHDIHAARGLASRAVSEAPAGAQTLSDNLFRTAKNPEPWTAAELSPRYFSNAGVSNADAVRGIVADIKKLGSAVPNAEFRSLNSPAATAASIQAIEASTTHSMVGGLAKNAAAGFAAGTANVLVDYFGFNNTPLSAETRFVDVIAPIAIFGMSELPMPAKIGLTAVSHLGMRIGDKLRFDK